MRKKVIGIVVVVIIIMLAGLFATSGQPYNIPFIDQIIFPTLFKANTGIKPLIVVYDNNNAAATYDAVEKKLLKFSVADQLGRNVDKGRIDVGLKALFLTDNNAPVGSWNLKGKLKVLSNNLVVRALDITASGIGVPDSDFGVLLDGKQQQSVQIADLLKQWRSGENTVSMVVDGVLDVNKPDGGVESATVNNKEVATLTFNLDTSDTTDVSGTVQTGSAENNVVVVKEPVTAIPATPQGVTVTLEFQVKDSSGTTRPLSNVNVEYNGKQTTAFANTAFIDGQQRQASTAKLDNLPEKTDGIFKLTFPDAEKSSKPPIALTINSAYGRTVLVVDDRSAGKIICSGCTPEEYIYREGFGGKILSISTTTVTGSKTVIPDTQSCPSWCEHYIITYEYDRPTVTYPACWGQKSCVGSPTLGYSHTTASVHPRDIRQDSLENVLGLRTPPFGNIIPAKNVKEVSRTQITPTTTKGTTTVNDNPLKVTIRSNGFEVSKMMSYIQVTQGNDAGRINDGFGGRSTKIQYSQSTETIPAIFTDKDIPPHLWGQDVEILINNGAYKSTVKIGRSDGVSQASPNNITMNLDGKKCDGCEASLVKLSILNF